MIMTSRNCNELDLLKYEIYFQKNKGKKMRKIANIRIKYCSVDVYGVIYLDRS